MPNANHWTYEQTLIALRVYLDTRYGRLNLSNHRLAEIGKMIGRSHSAVVMKCCNFASMDPFHAARGVKGLPNAGGVQEKLWDEFQADSDAVAEKMEAEWEKLTQTHSITPTTFEDVVSIPDGPSEVERTVRTRRLQRAFRIAVLVGYDGRCALTGLSIPALLNASHIIPWSKSEGKRADPRNGLCLNALHDRAFDRGLLSFDEDFRVMIAPGLNDDECLGKLAKHLKGIEGKPLAMPERFGPLPEAMAYHRENIFQSA
ncbi:HNH endonuclease [Phycisphaeraceae bacterium D3-23]